jgi:DNA-binding response OmpR family regulator
MNTQKKILIAEDELISLDFFEVMLTKLGFIFEKTGDGGEVIEKVKKVLPDLILLDNIMPGMTGWEITKTLRSDPALRHIPIIMLSALDDVKDKVAGFEAGVDDYITKPFNFSEVLARINAVFRTQELYAEKAAGELNKDLKENLSIFIESVDELDKAVAMITEADKEALVKPVSEKIASVRKQIAALDAKIEKTVKGLKK